MSLLKNTASQVVTFCLVNATTGAALTGATVTTKVALDGTQAAGGGTVTELGSGQYKYVPSQAETNGASVGILFTATNAVPVNLQIFTDTGDAYARLGAPAGASVSADVAAVKADTAAVKVKTDYLPSATAGAAGGVFIAGANAATSITGALTANITGSMSGNVEGNVNGSVGSVVGNVGGNVTGSVGSVVGFTPSNIADIISTLGSPNGASVSVDIAAVKNDTALMKGATFDTATDSLEAIRNRGDAAWATATGFSTLDAAGVRAALGMATNDLDAQIAALPTAAENADANWDEARAGHVAAGSFGENVVADVTKVGGNAASISPTPGLLNARLTEISVSGAVALGVIQNGNVVAGVTNPVAVNSLANNVVTSAALDATAVNEIADGLLDRTNGIDIGLTPRHALELAAASVLQKLTGAGTGTERVRNFADTADLATVTVDGAGNKSAIIYDFSI